jgi:hypothetical protein
VGVLQGINGLGLKGYEVLRDESCCFCVHGLMCVTGLGIKKALCCLLLERWSCRCGRIITQREGEKAHLS